VERWPLAEAGGPGGCALAKTMHEPDCHRNQKQRLFHGLADGVMPIFDHRRPAAPRCGFGPEVVPGKLSQAAFPAKVSTDISWLENRPQPNPEASALAEVILRGVNSRPQPIPQVESRCCAVLPRAEPVVNTDFTPGQRLCP